MKFAACRRRVDMQKRILGETQCDQCLQNTEKGGFFGGFDAKRTFPLFLRSTHRIRATLKWARSSWYDETASRAFFSCFFSMGGSGAWCKCSRMDWSCAFKGSIVGCNAILQSYTHNETKRKNGNIKKSFKVVKNSIEEWNVLHGLKRRNDAFVRFAGRKSTWGRKQSITGMWIGGNVETFRDYCNDRPTILVDSNRIRRVSAGIPREKAAYRWIWRVLFRRI